MRAVAQKNSQLGIQTMHWMFGGFLGLLDFTLWILLYYTLSKLSGSYNHISVSSLLLPPAILITLIGLVRGYRYDTDFASLQYASEHLIACLGSFPVSAFFLYVVASFGSGANSSRAILLVNLILFGFFSLLIRRFFWFSTLRRRGKSKFLVVADRKLGAIFHADYLKSGQYQTVQFCSIVNSQECPDFDGKNSEAALLSLLENENISQLSGVIIAARLAELGRTLIQKMLAIHFGGIPVYSMENFYSEYWNRMPLELVGPEWVIEANLNLVKNSVSSMAKRFSDLLIAVTLIILLSPLMLFVAVLIVVTDGAPVIYAQQRIGIHQIPFTLYKFRTMSVGSDRGDPYTRSTDERVSSLGSILRRTRLDELPQLWTVLRGDMSFIGPRAEWFKLVETYEREIPHYHLRHLVRPGITGWAQVKYPYGTSVGDAIQKLSYDLYYIRNFSFKLDAAVLLKTVYVVCFGKGR